MRDKKASKIQDSVLSTLPVRRLVILDGLLRQHIAAQVANLARQIVQKNYNMMAFPLRLINLPAKAVFLTASVSFNTASISFSHRGLPQRDVTIGRWSEWNIAGVAEHAAAVAEKHKRFKLSSYAQAALFCKPLLDFLTDGVERLPDFYALTPLEAGKLYSGKTRLPDEMLEDRIIPKNNMSDNTLDLDEIVKLLETDFPNIYRDYAISSFESALAEDSPGR